MCKSVSGCSGDSSFCVGAYIKTKKKLLEIYPALGLLVGQLFDLREANLSKINLIGANLFEANLSG